MSRFSTILNIAIRASRWRQLKIHQSHFSRTGKCLKHGDKALDLGEQGDPEASQAHRAFLSFQRCSFVDSVSLWHSFGVRETKAGGQDPLWVWPQQSTTAWGWNETGYTQGVSQQGASPRRDCSPALSHMHGLESLSLDLCNVTPHQ